MSLQAGAAASNHVDDDLQVGRGFQAQMLAA